MSSWSVWSYLFPFPLDKRNPPDLHGFYKWVFDSIDLLNDVLKQVVVSRVDAGVRKSVSWLWEDLVVPVGSGDGVGDCHDAAAL